MSNAPLDLLERRMLMHGVLSERPTVYVYIYIYIYIYMYDYTVYMRPTRKTVAVWQVFGGGRGDIHDNNTVIFQNVMFVCCGLDPGNLKFDTVRTNKQHICF